MIYKLIATRLLQFTKQLVPESTSVLVSDRVSSSVLAMDFSKLPQELDKQSILLKDFSLELLRQKQMRESFLEFDDPDI